MSISQKRLGGGYRQEWRWVVLFGAFLSFFIADGWSYSFPMLFPNLVEEFQASRGVTAYVPTLLYAIPMLLSHLACSAVPRLGCKKLGIFGGFVMCISLILASVSNSLLTLLLSVGILSSVALVAMYISAYVAVTYWFDDSTRGLATGIAVAGSGLGSVLFPHFMEWLMGLYAWRGMVLVVAAVCFNATISGCLYRPFPAQQTTLPHSQHDLNKIEESSPKLLNKQSDELPEATIEQPLDCKTILKTSIPKVSLLKERLFTLFCLANFILFLWVSIPYLYIYDWAVEVIKLPPDHATWVLSTIGVARTVGQILIGLLVDRSRVSPNLVLAVSVFLCAISVFLIPFTYNLTSLLILLIIFGFTVSSTYVLPMLCMGELIGLDQAIPGLGLLQFFQGIATIAGSPLGGWIHDFSGSYDWAFYISGVLMAFAALLLFLLPCPVSKLKRRNGGDGISKNNNKSDSNSFNGVNIIDRSIGDNNSVVNNNNNITSDSFTNNRRTIKKNDDMDGNGKNSIDGDTVI